jgi:hypothetical protein
MSEKNGHIPFKTHINLNAKFCQILGGSTAPQMSFSQTVALSTVWCVILKTFFFAPAFSIWRPSWKTYNGPSSLTPHQWAHGPWTISFKYFHMKPFKQSLMRSSQSNTTSSHSRLQWAIMFVGSYHREDISATGFVPLQKKWNLKCNYGKNVLRCYRYR